MAFQLTSIVGIDANKMISRSAACLRSRNGVSIARRCRTAVLATCPAALPASSSKRRAPALRSAAVDEAAAVALPASATISQLSAELSTLGDAMEKLRYLVQLAQALPPMPAEARTPGNRVMGCTAQVWFSASLRPDGRVALAADSDSEVSKGLAALLVRALEGLTPEEVLQVDAALLRDLPLGPAVATPGRSAGLLNMLETAKKRVRLLGGAAAGAPLPTFPSLVVGASRLEPQGAFAAAQARYLQPDDAEVDALVELLSSKKIGVVAHFYMDPQVQGVLAAAAARWPHIHISDSLVMADRAVKMAEAGCTTVAVLGVDFMSENVRAILDEAGWADVKVFRMASDLIGCSLAEAAEGELYNSYLGEAATTPSSLHVVYINTSLITKATAHARVPTITCTSSNVVQTVLAAFEQVPDCTVWYGPDTYMGANLATLFSSLAGLADEEVAALYPGHTAATIRDLLPRLRYFQDGTCIVHHMFGGDTTELVAAAYGDAYLTAHFEVPGEMFKLAMQAKGRGRGVVGSTQNILDFIAARVKEAVALPFPERLQFVLGTESGMVTAIVRTVQQLLRDAGREDVEVEIVFPVSPEAITTSAQESSMGGVTLPNGLAVLPGAAVGEGCSTEGGCASCPYMKMNSLQALMQVCERVDSPGEALLDPYRPREYAESVNGMSVARAGCLPILHMRSFQRDGALPQELVDDIVARNRA